jgi:hypothetical protein
MIKEEIIKTEYHKNGTLFFKEKRAIIDPFCINIYNGFQNLRTLGDTNFLILERTKFYDNGQFAWSLKWNENGNLINTDEKQFRKDGSIIMY